MYDWIVLWDFAQVAVRWLHVVTAMAWIGSSFYFVALDLGLKKAPDLPPGAHGEEWQVHGGGFYHIRKYLVAPEAMPEHLVWFKWESYTTWLSGFALLCLVYYQGAGLFLIDPQVRDLTPSVAIAISLGSLGFGWIAYNAICKAFVNANQTLVMAALFGVLVGMAVFYTQVFSGRAALLHLGAFTATIMSGNVFFVIMPNQRIVVADLIAGRKPDAKYGKIAKQRSTHNNYLTLPVVFLMLSNHYPLVFATEWNWLIASLIFLMGVTIRHWFNTRHAGKPGPVWALAASALLFLAVIWLATAPLRLPAAEVASTDEVVSIVQGRCSMCHAREPVQEGIHWAPKGVVLETEADVFREARRIYEQAGLTGAMPPANLSFIEPEERAAIRAWFEARG
jgi:uncharacterized membrane protein